MTRYPNSYGHEKQEEAGLEVHQFYPLVEVNYSISLFLPITEIIQLVIKFQVFHHENLRRWQNLEFWFERKLGNRVGNSILILQVGCYKHLKFFLCAMYTPICQDNYEKMVMPCMEVSFFFSSPNIFLTRISCD